MRVPRRGPDPFPCPNPARIGPTIKHGRNGGTGMSGGILYFYRTYTATASGSRIRRERCTGCSRVFEYRVTREVQGGGHSAFFLNNAGAAVSAKMRARANLDRALDEAIKPVHCPSCGIYQPDMVRILRGQHGKQYEPNNYASARITVPAANAWRAACAANTIESYTEFKDVWPTLSWHADQQIKEIKYPPHVRKLVSTFGWIAWGAFGLFIIGISIGRM
jgi:hypothetical protein